MGGVLLIHQLIRIRWGRIGPPHLITHTVPYFGNKFFTLHPRPGASILSLSLSKFSHTPLSHSVSDIQFNIICPCIVYILIFVLGNKYKYFFKGPPCKRSHTESLRPI